MLTNLSRPTPAPAATSSPVSSRSRPACSVAALTAAAALLYLPLAYGSPAVLNGPGVSERGAAERRTADRGPTERGPAPVGPAEGLPVEIDRIQVARAAAAKPDQAEQRLNIQTFATGLEYPWALATLPNGEMLVTEKPGHLRLVDRNGKLSDPIAGVPDVLAQDQGGLLDVALDPGFESNRLIYLSFAERGPNDTAGPAVTQAKLDDNQLSEV